MPTVAAVNACTFPAMVAAPALAGMVALIMTAIAPSAAPSRRAVLLTISLPFPLLPLPGSPPLADVLPQLRSVARAKVGVTVQAGERGRLPAASQSAATTPGKGTLYLCSS